MLKRSILLIAVLLLVANVFASPQNSNRPTPSERRMLLVTGSHIVEPNAYVWWDFTVPRNGARVEGRFRAKGGSGNDIQVLILDEDAFENWRNGHTVGTRYNSGKITVGSINVYLEEGRYHIILTNRFSAVSNKVVTANIDLVN